MPATSENPTCFLRLPKVKQKTGYSRSSIYALMARSEFPAAINLGGRAIAWIDAEVEEWMNARIEASRGNGPDKGRAA